ncbi:glycoside hydrolase family 76 protein [Mucilaginibacter sp. UR6-1]|uniref:glycoside hydrolase family 76 protein n=1 Tax=Mucilaginibacter sp. UR6-1 TaxID=1435643 RepID=UPI001E309FC2|nr:glycoside hydrolase family 76 protein [Mucilaginibacter sp. UR6-1]MCC8408122.1 glycoside hydrolase family 76 protein [Mucilaginibacter sp. UR6-1]
MKKQIFLSLISGFMLIIATSVSCKKSDPIVKENIQTPDGNKRAAAIPTLSEALVAMQVYNNNFYNQYGTYGPSYKAYYWKDLNHTGRMDFWTQAEAIEMFIDAYDANPSQDFKDKIHYLYNGMRDGYGTNWANNEFNDDIIWGALMCIRAYAITNDGGMLDMAKTNFDLVWNRAWDTQLGGGLWWKTDKQSKNVCVNAPAVICAMKIYQATGNADYKTKAKMIMDWMVGKFYVSNGEVKGAVNAANVITEGTRTYTQGTFIGACDVLRNEYPAVNYTTMANNVMNYTKNSMCNSAGILPDEYDTGDTQGFKGIFVRWACVYVESANLQSTYGQWLDNNATAAWSVRNSNGLMWGKWTIRTPDTGVLNAFETHNGVSMLNNVYRYH